MGLQETKDSPRSDTSARLGRIQPSVESKPNVWLLTGAAYCHLGFLSRLFLGLFWGVFPFFHFVYRGENTHSSSRTMTSVSPDNRSAEALPNRRASFAPPPQMKHISTQSGQTRITTTSLYIDPAGLPEAIDTPCCLELLSIRRRREHEFPGSPPSSGGRTHSAPR